MAIEMDADAVFDLSPLQTSLQTSLELCQTPASRTGDNATLPISQIHAELLSDIFIKFLEDDHESPDYAAAGPLVSFHTRADPTILGQVCSSWRNIALSTPALWTNIFILEPKISQIFRTRLWLDRAGNNLLYIAIHGTGESDPASLDEILLNLAFRREFWRKVDIELPNFALGALTGSITKEPAEFRNLESASLSIIGLNYHQPSHMTSIDAIWKAFHSSPVLHTVDWHDAYYFRLPTHIPWTQLTQLKLESEFDVESLVDILSSCTRIRVLSISQLSLSSGTIQLEPITLESLHTLTLDAAVKPGPLFEKLTLPSLQSLDLRHKYLDEHLISDFVSFQEFLIRSNCSLKTFALFDRNLKEDDLQAYISSSNLQNVTVLYLHVPISDKTIKSFVKQTDDERHEIMPFLEEMSLAIRASSDGLLAQMVTSRWTDLEAHKSYKPLRMVLLHKAGDYGSEDKIGLSASFDSGLRGGFKFS